MIFLAASFTNTLQAQSSCTAAQVKACKKISTTVSNSTSCTPAQKAACQKICNSKTTKVAAVDIIQNPIAILTSNQSEEKKSTCSSSAKSVKLTKNETPNCTTKKSSVASSDEKSTQLVAQKITASSSN